MARRGTRAKKAESPEALRERLQALMERHDSAESLNESVITPFVAALEAVCEARGYVLNIFGARSNLIFTTEEDAEAIYNIVEGYLDETQDTG
jgi:hypothetical protein